VGDVAGFATVVVRRAPFAGDTLAVASELARTVRRVRAALRGSLPALVIAGGETTVRLFAGAGRGGRNQELAAALAIALADVEGVALLAAGSDGSTDRPTPPAPSRTAAACGVRCAPARHYRRRSAATTFTPRWPGSATSSDPDRPGPTLPTS
jgi:glycerate-2-kinase